MFSRQRSKPNACVPAHNVKPSSGFTYQARSFGVKAHMVRIIRIQTASWLTGWIVLPIRCKAKLDTAEFINTNCISSESWSCLDHRLTLQHFGNANYKCTVSWFYAKLTDCVPWCSAAAAAAAHSSGHFSICVWSRRVSVSEKGVITQKWQNMTRSLPHTRFHHQSGCHDLTTQSNDSMTKKKGQDGYRLTSTW